MHMSCASSLFVLHKKNGLKHVLLLLELFVSNVVQGISINLFVGPARLPSASITT